MRVPMDAKSPVMPPKEPASTAPAPHWLWWVLGVGGFAGLVMLFVAVFSDVYSNPARVAPIAALALLALAVVSYRYPQKAACGIPVAFVIAVVLPAWDLAGEASPRRLIPVQVIFAICLGAGAAGWRRSSDADRLRALGLFSLAAILMAQGMIHSPFSLSLTYEGIPLALGAVVAGTTLLVRPSTRYLLIGYVLAGVLLSPLVSIQTLRFQRSAFDLAGFTINFLSAAVGLALVAAFVLLLRRPSPWLYAAVLVLSFTIVLGNSKGTLVGLAVAGVVALWLHREYLAPKKLAVGALGLIGATIIAYAAPAVALAGAQDGPAPVPGTRTFEDAGASANLRLDILRVSWPNMFVDPLIGLGDQPNKVYYRIEPNGQFTWSRSPLPDQSGNYGPHNALISMPASLGIPLALVIAALWVYALFAPRNPALRAAMVPLLVFSMVTALMIDWERSLMAPLLWLPLGLLVARGASGDMPRMVDPDRGH